LSDLIKDKLVGQTITDTLGSVTVTSEIAYSLWEYGEKNVAKLAIDRILEHQISSGEDSGAFLGFGLKQASTWATINALRFSLAVDPFLLLDYRIELCVRWLSKIQKNGGWGLVKESSPRCFYTAHCLLALLQTYQSLQIVKQSKLSTCQVKKLTDLESTLRKSIKKAQRFLLKRRIGSLPLWSKNTSSSDACVLSTLMGLLALIRYGSYFKPVLKREDIEKVYFDYIKPTLIAFKDFKPGDAWPKIDETMPVFSIHFHTPASLFMILELGIDPWDDLCLEMFAWLQNNYVREGQHVGWKGTPSNSPGKILLWATAYGLISLMQLRKVLENKSREEILDKIFTPSTAERINSKVYRERMEKCEKKIRNVVKTKNKFKMLVVILVVILLITYLNFLWIGWLWIVSNWQFIAPFFAFLSAISILYKHLRKKKRKQDQKTKAAI
jgi:hypothetical protein